jgi:lipoate-protein ligase A
MEVSGFTERLYRHFLRATEQARDYQYTSADLEEIKVLRDKKFSTWEWNFGYSPKYQFSRRIPAGEGHVNIHMNVEKGIIREMRIEGDFVSVKDVSSLEQMLIACIHDPETIRLKLSGIQLSDYISGLENEDFIAGIF